MKDKNVLSGVFLLKDNTNFLTRITGITNYFARLCLTKWFFYCMRVLVISLLWLSSRRPPWPKGQTKRAARGQPFLECTFYFKDMDFSGFGALPVFFKGHPSKPNRTTLSGFLADTVPTRVFWVFGLRCDFTFAYEYFHYIWIFNFPHARKKAPKERPPVEVRIRKGRLSTQWCCLINHAVVSSHTQGADVCYLLL